ncbi:MAG: rRNA cytosine-C5-methylase [Rikenellaceae bacterium]
MNLPELFVKRVKEELGEVEALQLCDALDGDVAVSVRYNPFKVNDIPSENPIGWSRWGRYLDSRPSFTLDSDFHAGAYYVQEASSQFVGHILSSEPTQGYKILDMCAAPGGKSTLYSTLVGADGLVLSNDIDKGRVSVLADNVRKWGVGNVLVSCNKPSQIAKAKSWFDVVAVDAPCSGEGMFRRGDMARGEWSENAVKLCAERQKEILESAWSALRAGGVLIYSTCTFNRDENEEVLEWFNSRFEDETAPYDSVNIDDSWGVTCGRVGDFQTFRFYPHLTKGEGLFVGVARKASEQRVKRATLKSERKVMTQADKASVKECERWVLNGEDVRFSIIADKIYLHSAALWEDIRSLSESLNIIYSGVAMGQIFKGKLKPDHALALYHNLNRDNISCVEVGDEDILIYLRKMSLDATLFSEGLNLVTSRGKALGFAKRIGARVNNMYPNSLRILK